MFLIIYFFIVFAILWTYGGYLLIIIILTKLIKKKYSIDSLYQPPVTVVVPTYNEESVIAKKLENLIAQDYPKEKLQVIVVDSASLDKTRDIVKNYVSYGIELIEQDERKGKGAAIRYALNFAKNEIVVVTDANAYFKSDTLKYLLRNFSDPLVGGVTGRYLGKDIKDKAGTKGTILFRDYENILRKYETQIDSVVSLFGEIFAARKKALTIDEKNLTEDFEASVYIRKNGYRLAYESEAQVFEYIPYSLKDILIQRKRVIIGTIQTLLKYKYILFNPKYGFYGTVILPGHKLFPVLSPFFLIGFIILSVIFLKIKPFIFFYILISLVVVAIILKLFKKESFYFSRSIKYVALLNIACLLAWKDYLIGNYTVKWKKMEGSRVSAAN